MSVYTYRDRQLWVESVSLQQLAEQYGTPLYVYSKRAILDDIRRIEDAFGGIPHLTYYAVKANANRELLRMIAGEGLGADVGSKGELYLALTTGFAPNKITFSGVGKRDDEIAFALEHRILAFNVESTEEIEVINQIAGQMGTRAAILLRVNLDIDAGGHAYVSTSMHHNKFGLPHTRALEVLRWAAGLSHIAVRGVHSHIGSQILRPATFLKAAEAIAGVVQKLREGGVPVHDVDFGGGYGIQYHGFVNHPELPRETPEDPALSTAELLRPALARAAWTRLHAFDTTRTLHRRTRRCPPHAGSLPERISREDLSHRRRCNERPDPSKPVSCASSDRASAAQQRAP